MSNVVDIETKMPHDVSEVMCGKCLKRWICVRPSNVWLKDIECPNCGAGYVINTGQHIDK